MWLYIIMGLLSWVGIYPMTFQILMLAGVLYCVVLIPKYKISNFIDLFVILYIVYIFLNAIGSDYPHKYELLRNELIFSAFPVSFYFIAKSTGEGIEKYLKKMIVPMTVVMVIGIILYIVNPPWYSALKYAQLLDSYGYTEATVPERMEREAFRLSSIWNTAYVIGYANGVFILFLLNKIVSGVREKKERRITYALFVLSFVVMILAGFKSLLLAFAVSIFIFIALIRERKKRIGLIFGAGAIVLIAAITIISIDSEYYNFFIQRFQDAMSEEGMSYRLEHTGGGIELNSLFGAGFGHYGMAAKNFNGWFIQDSQYQKTLAELGVFGFTIFVLLLLTSGFSALKRNTILELCILATYMISFVGSSSISAETTFPFIFWYVLGCISYKSSSKSKINHQLKTINRVV